MTGSAPLVRDEHGAILGVDWRRTPLAVAGVAVPGAVPARAVMPGDTLRWNGEDVLVLTRRANGAPGMIYLGVRTASGAEIVLERRLSEVMDVIGVGAFDV